jgi:hypothetical protein
MQPHGFGRSVGPQGRQNVTCREIGVLDVARNRVLAYARANQPDDLRGVAGLTSRSGGSGRRPLPRYTRFLAEMGVSDARQTKITIGDSRCPKSAIFSMKRSNIDRIDPAMPDPLAKSATKHANEALDRRKSLRKCYYD